jgi:NAD(P)-dependent dehydrogenase (short-subunit alcohol dehydrogenase family)
VFNGSAWVAGPATGLDPDALRTALDVGVVGALVAAQEVAGPMRERRAGTIVLTGSVAADRASTGAAAVGIAKAALRNLSMSLSKALAPDGVRVVTVTIDGVLTGPKALDLDEIAERYWRLHTSADAPPPEVRHP